MYTVKVVDFNNRPLVDATVYESTPKNAIRILEETCEVNPNYAYGVVANSAGEAIFIKS